MRARSIAVFILTVLVSTFNAEATEASTENWTIFSVGPTTSVAAPKSTVAVTVHGSSPVPSYTASGNYYLKSSEWRSFIRAVTGIEYYTVSGTLTVRRSNSGIETITFTGPLGALGIGSSNLSRTTVTFRTRLGVTVIFSRLMQPNITAGPRLWTTATGHFRLYDLPATADAAEDLGDFVSDAEDVLEQDKAGVTEYLATTAYTRVLVDDAVANARFEGRTILTRGDVEKAKRRFCPIYPFCRRYR